MNADEVSKKLQNQSKKSRLKNEVKKEVIFSNTIAGTVKTEVIFSNTIAETEGWKRMPSCWYDDAMKNFIRKYLA